MNGPEDIEYTLTFEETDKACWELGRLFEKEITRLAQEPSSYSIGVLKTLMDDMHVAGLARELAYNKERKK